MTPADSWFQEALATGITSLIEDELTAGTVLAIRAALEEVGITADIEVLMFCRVERWPDEVSLNDIVIMGLDSATHKTANVTVSARCHPVSGGGVIGHVTLFRPEHYIATFLVTPAGNGVKVQPTSVEPASAA